MGEQDALIRLISRVYDASVDRDEWSLLIAEMAELFTAEAALRECDELNLTRSGLVTHHPLITNQLNTLLAAVLEAGRQASAVVFLTRPGRSGLSIEGLADLFGLTPAEAHLTIAIAEGESLNAFAKNHHISSHTARTQIKRAFEKTGTHSQAGLVGRVLTSPLLWQNFTVQNSKSNTL